MRLETYKHNSIIGNGITLSLQQERYLNVCLGKEYKKDLLDKNIYYKIDVAYYAEKTKIGRKQAFQELKQISIELLKAIVYFKEEDESFSAIQIAHKVNFKEDSCEILVKFHEDFIPLISGFKYGNFTTLCEEIATFRSINTINLYQILKKESFKKEFFIKLETLQKQLGVEYKLFGDFKAKFLEPNLKILNEKSDIFVKTEYVKNVRKVVGVKFFVERKENE